MPDPAKFKTKEEFISACIEENIKEGLTPEQAAGKCYGWWDNYQKSRSDKMYHIKDAKDFAILQSPYECECIECGYRMTSDQHCKDLKCPKCGGQMRRVERPGVGQS